MKQKIIKTGNSAAVTVPAAFVQTIGIKIGDQVKVRTDIKNRQVIYRFSGVQQLALNEGFLKSAKKIKK